MKPDCEPLSGLRVYRKRIAARGSTLTLAAMLGAVLLSGCASTPSAGTAAASTAAPTAAASRHAYRQNIAIEGRLSLRYQQNNQPQSMHGSFVWTQNGEQIDLRLLSPLGQTIAVIQIKPGIATLTQSGQPPRSAGDVDQLTAQTLGWPLPIAGLRDWLQGFATDDSGHPFIANAPGDGGAEPIVVTRDGWHIRYVTWQTATPDSAPKRIDLDRETSQAGPVEIRIVVDKVS